MTESALSAEADALYRPLGGIEPWVAAAGDLPGDVGPTAGHADGAWAEMVGRGLLLAAAHQSGALDGMHTGDAGVAMSLLRGSGLAAVGEDARAHVRSNYEALLLARDATDGELASEAWIRRVHAVACRPQLTHPVRGEGGVHDHVLATGDFKHHPNHARSPSGAWVAHTPVARLSEEMAGFLEILQGATFAALPAVVRAAYAHHGLTHVAPFADGNGRVARALAGAHLLRDASVPFLVFADRSTDYDDATAAAAGGDPAALVAFVSERRRAVVDLLAAVRADGPSSPDEAAALRRWQTRAHAGAVVEALLPAAVERALDRHRRRGDLGWLSPLTDVVVSDSPLLVRAPTAGVEEAIVVDAHPLLDKGSIALRATEASLSIDIDPEDLPPMSAGVTSRLDPWLDRVVSTLALRVAAELE